MTDREATIAAATAYLDALVSHDGTDVPLAQNCWRTEQGINTGLGATQIRVNLAAEIMSGITSYRDVRWFVDGDDAIAFYVLEAYGTTTQIVERFRVVDGEITEIEALFHINDGSAPTGVPDFA